jgi:hypothetical protein
VILALFPRRSSCCHKGVGAWLRHRSSLLIRLPRSPVGWRWSSPIRRSYSSSPPGEVRQEARRLLRRITVLLGGRLTLQQRRQLLVAAGWLSLLASALHYDVGDRAAAEATREVALQLGRQASHQEILAWAFEAQAWFAVCDGRYGEAVDFARAGQGFAGRATSAAVQLAVQEARAWARRGDKAAVRDAMRRASAALRRLPRPSHPEHHFVFDPDKLLF